MKNNSVKKAVIPAAGFGTRLLPTTAAQPKEMLTIVDKPVIQFVIEEAVDSGIKDILIITGRNKRPLEDHFDPPTELLLKLKEKGDKKMLEQIKKISQMANIHFIRQKEQLGLAHAIGHAQSFVNGEPFAVMLGDAILKAKGKDTATKQLIKVFNKYNKSAVAVEEIEDSKLDRYGVIEPEKKLEGNTYQVKNLVEKPGKKQAPSNLAICSRYILKPNIFKLIKKTKPGKNGEIQLTDTLVKLAKKGNLLAQKINGRRFDIGNKADFVLTNILFGLEHPETKKQIKKGLDEIRN